MACKRYFRVLPVLLSIFTLAIAGVASAARASEQLNVVASTPMIADAVKNIGGERVAIKALMAANVDPHTYTQTRSDIVALSNADLILWNGLELEEQLEDTMKTVAEKKTVVAVAEALPKNLLSEMAKEEHGHGHDHGAKDPHVWMSPILWSQVVGIIRDAMVKAGPESANLFKSNTENYLKALAKLDSYAKEVFASIPANNRVLITSHDAFGYFSKAYSLEVVGIQGLSTASEPGLKRIADLAKILADKKVPAIFVEASVAEDNVRSVIEGAAALGHKVELGAELYSDSMGQPGSYEGTYIGMMDHNVTFITRALGGTAPVKGMDGKLSD